MGHRTNPGKERAGAGRLEVPWDLSDWFEKRQLLEWIQAEIDTLNWSSPALQDYLQRNPAFRPRLMMDLLTYAYAIGTFESGEVTLLCDRDPLMRSLCEGTPVSEQAVRRFRRENRGLLKWSLAQLLRRVLRARFNLGERALLPGLNRHLQDLAVNRLGAARQMDHTASGF